MTSRDDKTVHNDSYLTLHYKILLRTGALPAEEFINTFNGPPATLQMGSGQWAETMEAPLIGHKEGDQFSFELSAAKAFGERNPELVQTILEEAVINGSDDIPVFEINDRIEFTAPNGSRYSGLFKGRDGENVIIDFNHPLAGQALHIEVKIIGVM